MARAIFAFRDLAANTAEMQRLALFFDHIFLWMPLSSQEISADENQHMTREIKFLREQQIVCTVSSRLPFPIPDLVMSNGVEVEQVSVRDKLEEGIDMFVPFIMTDTKTEGSEKNDDEYKWMVYREHGSKIVRQSEFGNEPIALYHSLPQRANNPQETSDALALTIKDFALPPENMPWQDLLQFRNDSENQRLLREFKRWLHKTATQEPNLNMVVDELHHLMHEYKKFNLHHHNKYQFAKFSIAMAAGPAIFTSLPTAAAALLGGAFEIGRRRIALQEALLSTPGREISYFIKAQDHIERNTI